MTFLLALLLLQTPATGVVRDSAGAWQPAWYNPALTAAALAAQGATGTVWTHEGTLPPGLTLDSGGMLTGTPSQAGTFAFTIKATLNGVFTVTRAVTITIAPATIIDPAPPPPGIVGTAYQFQFKTTTQESIP